MQIANLYGVGTQERVILYKHSSNQLSLSILTWDYSEYQA